MKIAILGAGFTGLTAAYKLTKRGHQVFVFEKESRPGGLARGFKLPGWDWSLEENYHHLFASDTDAFKLIKTLGLSDKLFFKKPITGVYYKPDKVQPCQGEKHIYPLDTPLNFLLFPHLSAIDKLRSGLALSYLKLTPDWKNLEKVPAKKWIRKTMGNRVWKVLWEPLFVNKLGKEFAHKVPASWFWARIKKRSQKLVYIKGGFQALAEKAVKEIEKFGGEVLLETEVVRVSKEETNLSLQAKIKKFASQSSYEPEKLKMKNYIEKLKKINSKLSTHNSKLQIQNAEFEKVISTIPTPSFIRITPRLPQNYIKRLHKVTHLNALTLVLVLKKRFLQNTYWLNICDFSFPFLLLVEHTNFVNPRHYGDDHILYIGNYLPDGHPYFSKSKRELLKIFLPYLEKINPSYNFELCTLNFELFTSPFAQPVFPTNYSVIKPKLTTPLPELYLANQTQVYPWDRGVNYAIKLGNKVAAALS